MIKRSILVVDDDKSIRDYLFAFLTSCGYGVECAASGDQALARVAGGPLPSVILLDILLPGMDGLEVLKSLKTAHPTIPIIILSGIRQIKPVLEGLQNGASD